MSRAPIAAIVRREMVETLADWRLLVPLLALTFAVPALILLALLVAAGLFPDGRIVAPLAPLAVLVCGFLPAGFSLVNASESFVGEKERNTLESLLATPALDFEIFLGKLLAALLAPWCSSTLAIVTFAGLFALRAPPVVAELMTVELVATVAALVGIKTLAMVAAAVLISIHATTLRAANLLASFVLVPMAMTLQLEAVALVSGQAALLLPVAVVLLGVGVLLAMAGSSTFNREAMLSREHRTVDASRTGERLARFLARPQAKRSAAQALIKLLGRTRLLRPRRPRELGDALPTEQR